MVKINHMTLAWWEIRNFIGDERPDINARYECKGWVGLTITNMSISESNAVRKWAKDEGKHLVYCSRREWDYGEHQIIDMIGSYRDFSFNLWFCEDSLRQKFIDYMKGFPVRTEILFFKDAKKARPFLRNTNYKMFTGWDGSIVAITDELDATDRMLIKLAAS